MTTTTPALDDHQYRADVSSAKAAARAYYDTDTELMSDTSYDELLAGIAAYEAANPDSVIEHGLFSDVAAGTSTGGTVTYDGPMISLDKVTDLAEIEAFAERIAAAGGTVSIEPKFDGMAFNTRYDNGGSAQPGSS